MCEYHRKPSNLFLGNHPWNPLSLAKINQIKTEWLRSWFMEKLIILTSIFLAAWLQSSFVGVMTRALTHCSVASWRSGKKSSETN